MTASYPFPHDYRVYVIGDDRFEIAYYSRDLRRFKRVRDLERQTWDDTIEIELDPDSFWMVVACIELAKVTNRR